LTTGWIVAAFVVLCGACIQQNAPQDQPSSNAPVAANSNVNTNTAVASSAPSSSQVQVTLPLVDALMNDEGFVNDAKSSLKLTDDQVQKLKDAARNDVLTLDENDNNDTRSTRAAIKKAEDTIKKTIGDDKGEQFLDLVRQRGAETSAVSPPNSIPKDTRIVINAPAYRMDEFKDGQLVKSYKVGIGYPEWPLPTGLRKATEIIFSPTWTPPDSPWVKGKFAPGKTVEAGSKDNPLGILKIPIGLPNLIHGGKHPGKLGTFASHGCVGLTNDLVRKFAVELADMGGTQLTLDEEHKYEQQKTQTQEVKLSNSVPVELRYETIVVQNGKLIVYRDVYEKGTNTEENLKKVLDAAGVSFDSFSAEDQQKMLDAVKSMALDAHGDPVDENANENDNKSGKSKSGSHITTTVKGKKDITLAFGQLAGKGYPDPVNLEG
jgi:lipoprotein-anchoring transpeptidase ErfK/SrfK